MPIYEYRCRSCGFEKEYLQKLSDAPITDCPSCGKAEMGKLVSAAGFQLKGSGWYVTDFKNNGAAKKDGGEKKDGEKKGEAKSGGTESSEKSGSSGDKSGSSGDKSGSSGDKSGSSDDKSSGDKSGASGDKSGSSSDKSAAPACP
jgi:putative FmdB family regulatory protein